MIETSAEETIASQSTNDVHGLRTDIDGIEARTTKSETLGDFLITFLRLEDLSKLSRRRGGRWTVSLSLQVASLILFERA